MYLIPSSLQKKDGDLQGSESRKLGGKGNAGLTLITYFLLKTVSCEENSKMAARGRKQKVTLL
jgi:hypothetical protein